MVKKIFNFFLFGFVGLLLTLAALVISIFMEPQERNQQERRCPSRGSTQPISADNMRLVFVDYEVDLVQLWYEDNQDAHETSYQFASHQWHAAVSPAGNQVLVLYEDVDSREIVYQLVELTTGALVDMDIELNPAILRAFLSVDWLDDDRLGAVNLRERKIFRQNVFTGEFSELDWGNLFDDSEGLPDVVSLSPNLEYVLVSSEEPNSFEVISLAAQETVLEFSGRIPTWHSDSSGIAFLDESGQLVLLDLAGHQEQIQLQMNDVEMYAFTVSPQKDVAAAYGAFTPTTPQPSDVMFLINLATGDVTDICTYGNLRIFTFPRQVGIWSQDGDMFAFTLRTPSGVRIFLLNLDNYTMSLIPSYPEFRMTVSNPILIGWDDTH